MSWSCEASPDVGLENYTLATDVSAEDLAAVMELSIPGVIVESSTVRVYNTKYAAHLLGSIGSIEAGDWPEYRDKGLRDERKRSAKRASSWPLRNICTGRAA